MWGKDFFLYFDSWSDPYYASLIKFNFLFASTNVRIEFSILPQSLETYYTLDHCK